MKNEFTVEEINEQLVECIAGSLTNFCNGEYKDEETYPVVYRKSVFISGDKKAAFNFSYIAHKTRAGILRNMRVTINKADAKKKKFPDKKS